MVDDAELDTAAGAFRRDGVAVLRGVLSPEWIDALRAGVEHNRTHPSPWSHWYTNPDESVGFWSDYVTWRSVPEYQRVVFDSGLAHIAARLMGSHTARFFHEHVLVKEPGATERTPWHHDQPYYPVDGDQNVSMWIALDAVPLDTAVEFIAGSHLWNRWFIPRKFIDHTPYGNPSADRRRRVVTLRWVGDDAVWAERPWQVSPPYEPDGLRPGDPLDDERFPLAFPA